MWSYHVEFIGYLRSVHTDTVTVTLTGGTFDLFERHCDGQNRLHTHFAHHSNICYGDGGAVAWRKWAFKQMPRLLPLSLRLTYRHRSVWMDLYMDYQRRWEINIFWRNVQWRTLQYMTQWRHIHYVSIFSRWRSRTECNCNIVIAYHCNKHLTPFVTMQCIRCFKSLSWAYLSFEQALNGIRTYSVTQIICIAS